MHPIGYITAHQIYAIIRKFYHFLYDISVGDDILLHIVVLKTSGIFLHRIYSLLTKSD